MWAASAASNMGRISRGGPGSRSTARRPSAVRVRHDLRELRHERLPPVDLRHRHPASAESFSDGREDLGVFTHGAPEHLSHDITRAVVVGRPEPACAHEERDSIERLPNCRRERFAIVTHHCGRLHDESVRVEPRGDVRRVRVGTSEREHLAAHREDRRRRRSV
jgi:hypothetical protein